MNKKQLIMVTGYTTGLISQIVLWLTFIYAYIQPTKSTTIYINTFGEANIELCIIFITIPISILGFHLLMQYLDRK